MNMIPYGITLFGHSAIIRLRVKITPEVAREFRAEFKEHLLFTTTRKGYTLISGCIPASDHRYFWEIKEVALLDSKIAFLEAKRAGVLQHAVSPSEAYL